VRCEVWSVRCEVWEMRVTNNNESNIHSDLPRRRRYTSIMTVRQRDYAGDGGVAVFRIEREQQCGT
jgi:hypothetical protein